MNKTKRVFVVLFAVGIFSSPIIWWFWPNLKAEYAMLVLRSVDESSSISTRSVIWINTYRDEASSDFIKSYYNKAASVLARKSLNAKTYQSTKPESWGHVQTILENETGYIAVSAGGGNDSESFSISYISGNFDDSEKKFLASYLMPKGILRCDWNEPQVEQVGAGQPVKRFESIDIPD